jgi:hypothetical protein
VPDGFKVADAFVDVTVQIDDAALDRAAMTASDRAGSILGDGMDEAGQTSGERFGSSFSERTDRRMRDSKGKFKSTFDGIGDDTGKSSGDIFGSRFGGGLISKVSGQAKKLPGILTDNLANFGPGGAAVGAALVGVIALAAPLAGAALGAGLTAGVAGAGIGLGIAGAMRDDRVKAGIVGLKNDALDVLDEIGEDWAPTMIDAIGSIRGEMPGLGASLRDAIAPAKEYVRPLVQGFMGLVQNVMPGFNRLLASAGPIIAVLSDGLSVIGDALSDAFTEMSGHSDEFAAGLQTVLYLVADLIVMGGQVVSWLADAYATTVDWGVSFLGWLSHIPGVGDTFKDWQNDLKDIQDTANGVGPTLDGAGSSMRGLGGAADEAGASSEQMAIRQRILNGSMADGIDAAGDLKSAMLALAGTAQTAEQAELGWRDAIRGATASLKDNGKHTDINTEKGAANRRALLQLAQAGVSRAQAQYDQTAATKGTTAAEVAAQRSYANSRAKLIDVAQQMGMTRQQAIRYADKIMAIPKSWTTNINARDGVTGKVRTIKAELASMKTNWTITIRQNFLRFGKPYSGEGVASGNVGGLATGGPVTGPGPKGVDSELRVLAPGEHVLSDAEVDAAGGHRAIEAWRAALRAGVHVSAPAAPTPMALPAMAGGGGGTTHYNFERGSIVLDLSSFRSLADVVEAVEGLASAARTYRSATTFRGATA